jgi:hypothetical protein
MQRYPASGVKCKAEVKASRHAKIVMINVRAEIVEEEPCKNANSDV